MPKPLRPGSNSFGLFPLQESAIGRRRVVRFGLRTLRAGGGRTKPFELEPAIRSSVICAATTLGWEALPAFP